MTTDESTTVPGLTARRGFILLLLGLALTAVPVARTLKNPYEDDYHGGLTAWFGLMSENMVESGFVETRGLPVINPNPAKWPDFRPYVTHPAGDVILRASLMRVFGDAEWVARLQGLVGAFGAALFFYFVVRRYLSPIGSLAASLTTAAFPIFQRVAHLSMHHPMTLFFGMAALWAYHADRDRPSRFARASLFIALFAGMNFDWPGYFMAIAIWAHTLSSGARRDKRLLWQLPALSIAGVLAFLLHVKVIGDQNILEALKNASANPGPAISTAEWIERVHAHILNGFTPAYPIVNALALIVLATGFVVGRRGGLTFWLTLLLYGALNFVVFPKKAPFEDFWGFYGAPLGGFSCGVLVEALTGVLTKSYGKKPELLIAGLVVGVAAAGAYLQPFGAERKAARAGAVERGLQAKADAARLKEFIPPADRGLILTNYLPYDAKLLLAYSRINTFTLDQADGKNLAFLLGETKKIAHHIRGRRVLFYVNGLTDKPGVQSRFDGLLEALRGMGTPYRGVGNFYDITDYVWKN